MIQDLLSGKITPDVPPVAQLSDLSGIIKEVETASLVLLHATGEHKVAEILQYLKERIPRSDVLDAGLMVEKAPERSKSEDIRFLWTVRVAQNPLYVLQLMQEEKLCNFDVTVMQDLYPELYQQVANELILGVTEKFTPEQQIPRGIKTMLSIYLQIPVINAKTLQAYKEKEPTKPDATLNLAQPEQGA